MDSNNYPTYSYPDSNASSPRSRDLDYDNPPQSSFDDQSFSKVKFMVSYGGKIQPRSHDNFLSYLGGDTKILSVDRNVKFTTFQSKLASVVSPDMTSFVFKYQLPGEDLDALISVTNDDDLELMMQEFDRVMRGSIKIATARLRLFLFTDKQGSGSSDSRFGSANSETRTLSGPVCEPVQDMKFAVAQDASRVLAPTPIPPLPMPVPLPVQSNADFLFGLDRMSVQVPGAASEQELVNQMNRLQISAQEVQHKLQLQNQQKQSAAMYPPKTEDSYADPYQKSGYWQTVEQSNQPPQHHLQAQHHQQLQQLQQQQQIQQQQLQQQQQQQKQQPQPVYLVHPAQQQTNAYHTQSMMRPNQGGNYSVQQQQQQQQQILSSREQQPVYSTPAGAQVIMQGESAAYAKQKAYENSVSGRHVFYAPGQQSGVVAPQYPAMSAAPVAVVVSGADVRSGSGDGKIVHKIITTASPAATV